MVNAIMYALCLQPCDPYIVSMMFLGHGQHFYWPIWQVFDNLSQHMIRFIDCFSLLG
jgi:hypothetical protein